MIKSNKNILLIAALLCSAVAFTGCPSSTPGTNNGNTAVVTNTNKPSNTTTAPANTTKTESNTTTTTSGDKIGIAECDEYIEKYEACLTSIGEKNPQVQPTLKTAFEAQRKAFRDAAATPQGKSALGPQCKQAIDTAKQSTTAYGCKW